MKCRCPKWPHMCHLDICSPSNGQKKGRESNWQFDSRPLKVRNRPLPDVCWRSATWRWKALDKSYNFGLDLVSIWAQGEELWMSKAPGVQTETISGLHFGSPEKKSHLDASPMESCREYYMGEGGGFPQVRAMVSQVSPSARGLSQHPRVFRMWINPLVVGFGCRFEWDNTYPFSYSNLGTSSTPLYPLFVLEIGSGPQVPTFRNSTYLDPQMGLAKDLGARQLTPSDDFRKARWTTSNCSRAMWSNHTSHP